MSDQPDPPPGIFTQIRPLATYGRRALSLVWATSPWLTVALAALTLAAGLLPASIAYVGKFLVDSVVAAIDDNTLADAVWFWLSLEALLGAALAASQTALNICNNLLGGRLGRRADVLELQYAEYL